MRILHASVVWGTHLKLTSHFNGKLSVFENKGSCSHQMSKLHELTFAESWTQAMAASYAALGPQILIGGLHNYPTHNKEN